MAKKYYAVRQGKQTGIFETWEDCKKQVTGYSCADFKSFQTREEAEIYMGFHEKKQGFSEDKSAGNTTAESDSKECRSAAKAGTDHPVEIYVDGSYDKTTETFSYGMVVLTGTEELCFSQKIEDKELAKMHNVAGEIKGAEAAMQYAADNGIPSIIIYHDYEGIAKWCTGAWKANKTGTQAYKAFYDTMKKTIAIQFLKVTGHSNNKYNDMADELAKKALGLI
jgi:ribonuclease HI